VGRYPSADWNGTARRGRQEGRPRPQHGDRSHPTAIRHQPVMSGIAAAFTLEPEVLETLLACQLGAGWQEICGLCAVDATGRQHFLALRNYAADPSRFETSVLMREQR
jgi:hypothetical protein